MARIIEFGHTHRVPQGELTGQRWQWQPYQVDYLNKVFGAGRHIRRGILSVARRNGKTGVMAMLLDAYLYGPLAKRGSLILSASMSKEQAGVIFTYAAKMAELSGYARGLKILPSSKRISSMKYETEYRALSADAPMAVGFGARVVFFDEAGEIKGTKGRGAELFNNLETSLGSYSDSQMHMMSTQAAEDGDLLSIVLDDAMSGEDPRTVCILHTAPMDDPLDSEETWHKANPGLGTIRDLEDVRAQAEQALRLPALESDFRRRILNQRVQTGDVWMTSEIWKACAGEVPDFEETGWRCWGGLDLSGRTDLTALLLLAVDEGGHFYARCYAWTPAEGVRERERRDRTPYVQWIDEGWLRTTPGASIDFEDVAREIEEIVSPLDLQFINYDRSRMQYLRKEFARIESPLAEEIVVDGVDYSLLRPHGQGMIGMGPALSAAEHLVLTGRLTHDSSPLLSSAVFNAMVVGPDPAGNRKLDKRVSVRRIDPAVCLVMAARAACHDDDALEPIASELFVLG